MMDTPYDLDLTPFHSGAADRASGLFVCEGRWVVEALLASAFDVHSAVLTLGAHEDLVPFLAERCSVTRLPKTEVEALAGFAFHRGVMACARRPAARTLRDWVLSQSLGSRPLVVVICPQLADASNLGAIIRNAAALGADAVFTGTTGADPWSRKGVRASAGGLFKIPVLESPDLAGDRDWLVSQQGHVSAPWEIVGTALANAPQTTDAEWTNAHRALVLGAEDHGLDTAWQAACGRTLSIPMENGMDSLNVACASAIFLHALRAPRSL